jgi:3-carboxy-cis,cis-muconate cycloisomerase
VEHHPSGQERNGVLRLLSLSLLFSDEACAAALSDEKLLAGMARFEAALAAASAKAGLFPSAHAKVIAAACAELKFDVEALAREARRAGTLAIPFVRQLTEKVRAASPEAAKHVHFGATSQDVIDTAIVLCLGPACARLGELALQVGDATAALASRHRATPSLARTLLQPAAPAPFGWKVAMWLAPLARAYPRFRAAVRDACTLQFGGAAGTLAAFGARGDEVSAALALELGLPRADPWHGARDGFARLGAEAAILTGLASKIAGDIALLMQAEVAEVAEPASTQGGSSSMPHKRNPQGCLLALEAGLRAPGLAATLLAELNPQLERGLGQWQSQWFTLRELLCATGSALAAMGAVLGGLQVDESAMRRNLEQSRVPDTGVGTADAMIERALADWQKARLSAP